LSPAEERFLDEVTGIRFVSGHTARETEQCLVVFEHEAFEVHVATHAVVGY